MELLGKWVDMFLVRHPQQRKGEGKLHKKGKIMFIDRSLKGGSMLGGLREGEWSFQIVVVQ